MSYDLAILLVRIILGLAIAAHGAQKLFGWFGGYGIKGTGGWFESMGYRPGTFFATASGLSETLGGILIFLGLLGPAGPMLVIATMLVAIFSVHYKNGFWQSNNGWELNSMYIAASIAVAFAAPGAYAVDTYAPSLLALHTAAYAWIAVGLAIVGAFGNLMMRRPVPAPENTTATA